MDEENELALETTAYMQLLDLGDRRAELMPDDPTRSELEITYDIIEVDIQATLQSIRDRRIARAIHGAGRAADSLLINTIAQNELRAQNERERLLRLSRRSSRPSESSSSPGSSSSSDRSSASDSEPSDPSSPSSSISRLPGPSKRTEVNVPPVLRLPDGRDTVECIICSDLTAAAYQAPCGCFYDRNCIIKLFTKAMDDESMFPPRCCTQIIPLDQVRPILSSELIQTFKQKETEFSTPNRLYCSNRACSSFLGGAATTERGKTTMMCSTCLISTCSFCKGVAHAAHVPCKNDAAAQQVLTLGTQSGWMACPSCHHLVEKTGGCNHMVCRCRNQFCYACGTQWPSCRHG